ncbi:polysaccharide deacetylase family protein [Alteromonas gilva]|uniref:Polysaccharide deacetylase family protein n=1 Tax=Alteromonas gilva TaxID=2987522 RepID=A0ABT5KZ83_9ALTE|nr:polysaccharide deacetylase family protein [Alteromonas gilva]MDC8830082.1 polysaccharide deacetylase family protein [Alteromonas gilva]
MMQIKYLLAASLLGLVSLCEAQTADFVTWPNGAKAAVSLSYDDTLNSQLDNAIPALNNYNLKGSFYLSVSNEPLSLRMEEWRQAAKQGHELGNHTIYHPCRKTLPGRDWVADYADLHRYSLPQLEREIATTNTFLHAVDGLTERTYIPPCIDLAVNNDNTSIKPVLSKYFVGVKGVPMHLPPEQIIDLMPSGVSEQALIAYVEKAAQNGQLASIIFHGIGGDHLSVSTEAHEESLQHLASHPERFYVDSFINIMCHARDYKE